ncbi:MAG: FHA domain-containing protein [Planctomycetes bacterium]|nr:FHA domain-containing protein [Planctomycetota bacterium]
MATLYILQGPDKGKTFRTGNARVVLGRASEDVPLTDNSVSRRHAELVPENGVWLLRDLKSSNGTSINGLRIEHPTVLKHGDQIRMGATLIVFGGDQLDEQYTTATVRDLIDLADADRAGEASVIETLPSNEKSLVLAAPETAEAVRAWRIMYQLTEAIGVIVEPDELLNRVLDIIFEEMEVDRGFILIRKDGTGELEPKAIRFRHKPKDPEKITTSRTIINHVIKRCEGVLCTNAMADQRFGAENQEDSIYRYGLKSVICVPIIAHRCVHGVIHLDTSMSDHTYTTEQLRLANAIGHMTGMAIENAKLVQSRLQNERLAAAGETVAFLSHYIKNVLQGLRSGADVLELGLKRKALDTIEQGWQILDRSLDKIFNLTTNMLTFSKDREPNMVVAQVNLITQEAVDLAQRYADTKKVMLLTEFEEIPAILFDVEGIHQVALNLLNNAIEAAPEEKGIINVRTRYDAEKEVVVLTVEDNGPGIDPSRLTEVFQPFKSSKGQGGTGLGLAAAKKIIDEHQGDIVIEPLESGGTAFHASIPARSERLPGSDETLSSQTPK